MSRNPTSQDLKDSLTFYDRLGSDADVDLEPGYNQDEIFDDQFSRRANEIQRGPNASGAVAVIPAKKGPWSGNNQLGVERAFAPDANNRQTIIRLDEWDFPQVWSVMLGLKYSDAAWGASTSAAFAVTAEVEAGVGGAVQEFELDWSQGVCFSLNMNALNIVASYRGSPVTMPSDLRLVATLSKRKLTGLPPTRSFNLAAVVTGGVTSVSETTRIPDFARYLYVLDRSATAALTNFQVGVTVEFLANPNAGAGAICTVSGPQLASFAANGIPIPFIARYVRIRVDAAIAVVASNLVFTLGL